MCVSEVGAGGGGVGVCRSVTPAIVLGYLVYLPLMLLIRDEAIRGKSWFSRFSANSPSIFAKPTDYDT